MSNINPCENWVEREEFNLKLSDETNRIIERNKYVKKVINGIFPGMFKEVELSDMEKYNLLLEKLECDNDYDSNHEDDIDDGKLEWTHVMFNGNSKEVE